MTEISRWRAERPRTGNPERSAGSEAVSQKMKASVATSRAAGGTGSMSSTWTRTRSPRVQGVRGPLALAGLADLRRESAATRAETAASRLRRRWGRGQPPGLTRPARSLVATLLVGTIAVGASTLAVPPSPARAALAVVGVNDSLSTKHDRTRTVAAPGVLANDLNLLGGTTVSLVQDVTHGTLTLRSDGGYTYTPDPGYVGSDSFRYLPSGLLSTGARVSITVTNAAPVARNDAYSTPGRSSLVVPAPGVLANDTDGDGDALVAELEDGGGVSGSLDIDSDGTLRFSPGGGFSGSATVSYRSRSRRCGSARAPATWCRSAA